MRTGWKLHAFCAKIVKCIECSFVCTACTLCKHRMQCLFLGGLSSVYIEVKNLSLNNLDSRGPIDNTLAKINMRKNNGYYTFYDAPEHNFFKVNNREIHSIDLVLTDHKNRELILNGGEFSLTLTFHFMKKRQDIFDLKYFLKKDIIISNDEKRENERKNIIEE